MRFVLMLILAVASSALDAQEVATVDALLSEGRAHLMVARRTDAIVSFQAVLKRDKSNRQALFGLGTTYIELEQFEKGLDVLEPLLKQGDQDPLVLNNVAWALIRVQASQRRDPQRARSLAQRAVMQLSNEHSVWGTLTEAYYENREFDRAVSSARIALDLARRVRGIDLAGYRKLLARCEIAARAIDIVEE
jgi:tetratricopeptide (TPR) repeat protein